jgi:hypothetical protein
MWVYIVVFEGAYGMQIDGVFTSKAKANYHAEEMNKRCSPYCFEVKEYFAV